MQRSQDRTLRWDRNSVDKPREETERASTAPDQDGKLEVDNIMFMIVIVSIVTVS